MVLNKLSLWFCILNHCSHMWNVKTSCTLTCDQRRSVSWKSSKGWLNSPFLKPNAFLSEFAVGYLLVWRRVSLGLLKKEPLPCLQPDQWLRQVSSTTRGTPSLVIKWFLQFDVHMVPSQMTSVRSCNMRLQFKPTPFPHPARMAGRSTLTTHRHFTHFFGSSIQRGSLMA